MKIDFSASGVPLDPRLNQESGKRDIMSSPEGNATFSRLPDEGIGNSEDIRGDIGGKIGGDTVEIGVTSSDERPAKATYDMSDLKKKADTRLRQLRPPSDGISPLQETHLGSSRDSLVEMARKRMEEGFYSRPKVIDEIARRLAEEF